MGVGVHGRNATKAARRAVSVIRLSSLGFFRMFVDATTGALDRPR
jgi:hypothetical protein